MDDYYDQLEAQLGRLTKRGAHRRRFHWQALGPRIGADKLALGLAAAVVVAIVAAFLTAGTRSGHNLTPPLSTPATAPPRNPPPGTVVCVTTLKPPRGGGSASGTARIYEQRVGNFVLWATATGFPSNNRKLYGLWLANGPKEVRFVGSVRIPPTAGGRLTVRLKLPAGAGNFHLLLITGQASPRGTPSSQHAVAPGETVLEGPISF